MIKRAKQDNLWWGIGTLISVPVSIGAAALYSYLALERLSAGLVIGTALVLFIFLSGFVVPLLLGDNPSN